MIEDIIKTAMGRASFINASATARGCGDSEWIYDNQGRLEWYDERMQSLLSQATKEEIEEAKQRTNAPIY